MRLQSLGRPDRLFNRAAWHLAFSKRERPALGRFATRCLRNAGGGAVAPTKLDIRVSIRRYCSDAPKPQPLVMFVWSYGRHAPCVAFLFFSGNEQYQQTTHELFPGGKHGEVTSQRGKHLFYTYVLTSPEAQATQK